MKGTEAKVEKFFCNVCQHLTRHIQKAVHKRRYEHTDGEWAEGTWGIWECLGCEEVVMSECWVLSEDLPAYGDGYEPEVSLYPPRSSEEAKKKEYENIPEHLDLIYGEIIRTFNTEAYVLCSAGLRALLEAICIDREPSSSSLSLVKKIDGLRSSVPENIVKNLHGFRFLGNRALHELERPRRTDLALAISVMEDVLNVVYELDYRSAHLYRRVSRDEEPAAKKGKNESVGGAEDV